MPGHTAGLSAYLRPVRAMGNAGRQRNRQGHDFYTITHKHRMDRQNDR